MGPRPAECPVHGPPQGRLGAQPGVPEELRRRSKWGKCAGQVPPAGLLGCTARRQIWARRKRIPVGATARAGTSGGGSHAPPPGPRRCFRVLHRARDRRKRNLLGLTDCCRVKWSRVPQGRGAGGVPLAGLVGSSARHHAGHHQSSGGLWGRCALCQAKRRWRRTPLGVTARRGTKWGWGGGGVPPTRLEGIGARYQAKRQQPPAK